MLRRRTLQAAVAASVRLSSSSGVPQVWVSLHCGAPHSMLSSATASDAAWILRVPLDVDSVTVLPFGCASGARTHHVGALHPSRVLRTARIGPIASGSHATADGEDTRSPYEVTIDEALLPSSSDGGGGGGGPAHTVADLVRLLVDPDLTTVGNGAVEDVRLRDFAAMTSKRRMRAVGGDAEALAVVLSSERYQSEKDARELRLLGIATVGQWKEQPDRVQISAYSRGTLELAYNRLARHRQQSQKDEVVAWLTKAIRSAVADELLAPKLLASGNLGSVTTAATFAAASSSPSLLHKRTDCTSTTAAVESPVAESEWSPPTVEVERAAVEPPGRRRGGRHGAAATPVAAAAPAKGPTTKTTTGTAEGNEVGLADIADEDVAEVLEEVLEGGEVEDEETAQLMAEAEAILGQDAAPPAPTPKAPGTSASPPRGQRTQKGELAGRGIEAPDQDAGVEEEELVEEVEEEEVEEVEEVAGNATATPVRTSAAAPPPSPSGMEAVPAPLTAAEPDAGLQRREKLQRLAELMLKQFNTADGYLHPTNKTEREEQERRGDILVLDEDTAQVDPLAMFSTYHAATVTEADPVAVRALKTIWTAYNRHQMALEEATDTAAVEFYKRESVNALLYGSVLMRALAREEPVVVLEGTSLPPYGFPLVSSDTRPFHGGGEASASSSSVTDMTPGKVPTALQAYKKLLHSSEVRYSPFRPAVEQNAGCSVVRLSGTTLHLYYTSTKDHIVEEEVRLPFAEVMLGVLHLLRHNILPRVNVIHYHLIATKLADPTDGTDFMLRSTATIDLTNPFTVEEVQRLKTLAAPLGMAEEMEEYRCIDDLVMDIEEKSGASVVHSLLHNREDLEATLTATLAQLLPEDGDSTSAGATESPSPSHLGEASTHEVAEAEEVVEEEEDEMLVEEEEEEEGWEAPSPPKRGRKAAAATAPPPPSSATRHRRTRSAAPANAKEHGDDGDDDTLRLDSRDYPYDEENEADVEAEPAPPSRQRQRQPAPPTVAAQRPSQSSRGAGTDTRSQVGNEDDKEGDAALEEALYNQWRTQKQQLQEQRGKRGAAAPTIPTRSPATGTAAAAELDDGEDEEQVVEEEVAGLSEEVEVEEVEEEEDEEEEQMEEPPTPARSPAAMAPRNRGNTTPSTSHSAPPPRNLRQNHRNAMIEDDEVTSEPTAPRGPAGKPHDLRSGSSATSPRIPTATAAAAAAPSRHAALPPAPAIAPKAREIDGDEIEEEPRLRTRRGIRRTTARGRAPQQQLVAAREALDSGLREGAREAVPPAASADAAPADDAEDQWFRRRPKRRYFE